MFKKSDARPGKLFASLTGVAALALLSACASDDSADQPPADQETEAQTVQPDASPEETTAQPDASPEETTDDVETADTGDNAQPSGEDPVYEILGYVEDEYPDGVIVKVESGGQTFDVDVVTNNELQELEVTTSGDVSVDERTNDDDQITRADSATITVNEAIDQAFEEHPDATFDQADLDENDGSLRWEIELDGADGSEIELEVPAT